MCGLASRSCLQHCPDHDLFDDHLPHNTDQPPLSAARCHTCSYEAREIGIRSGMPIGLAWRKAPDAIYLDSTAMSIEEVEEAILKIVRSRVTNGKELR